MICNLPVKFSLAFFGDLHIIKSDCEFFLFHKISELKGRSLTSRRSRLANVSLPSTANERRLGVVAVILKSPDKAFNDFNNLLHQYSSLIIGRMGIPYKERGVSVVSLIVDGTNDEIGAMTGRIGQLPDVSVKAVLTRF